MPCRSLFPAFSLNAILPHPMLSALAMFNLWSLKITLLYFMVKARNIPFLREIRFVLFDLWATPTHPSEFSLKTALPPGSPSYLGPCPRHSTRPTIMTGVIHTRTFVSSRSFILFFFSLSFYLFIYGCVGSSFLREGPLQLRQVGATLHRGARASHYRSLSRCGAQAPDAQAQ